MKIDIIVPRPARRWHEVLAGRLAAAGHDLAVIPGSSVGWPIAMRAALALERRLLHRGTLSAPAELPARGRTGSADLALDLAGTATLAAPTLRLAFDGSLDDAAVPTALAAGHVPDIDVVLDGRSLGHAAPMVDNRVFVAAGADDIFARAITLAVATIARYAAGDRTTTPLVASPPTGLFPARYLGSTMPRIGREALRRRRYRFAHWRVGYRLHDGPGVAETAALGSGWSVLPDDGSRFFADPFPFEHDGRRYIFVEDYPHATRKAAISVSTLDDHGTAGPPVRVLEAPHHLSYPQVLARDGDIWMLPEGSGGGGLTLYRAERFPDRWSAVATLVEGDISDATLVEHDGALWLFATDRDGRLGSTSDTLVVYRAPTLLGPWTPHRRNPILIDRRRARPGGAVIRSDGELLLPVQDGTDGYGAGLGLSRVVRLDDDEVVLGEPRPISGAGDFPYPQIHTLNRAGRLEVIDGIAAVRKT
ncbi:MAG: glucosamine inositolphosphorylceramide transferase family protein [Devosia sp.]